MKRRNVVAAGASVGSMPATTTTTTTSNKNINSAATSNPTAPFLLDGKGGGVAVDANDGKERAPNDAMNYAILIALYTLQGIPIGLSSSIPFLIQQKIKDLSAASVAAATNTRKVRRFFQSAATIAAANAEASSKATAAAAAASRLSYNANAIFALCQWPFSLKLLWAPIVDAMFIRGLGRRKSWLVPVQILAGLLMVFGSDFVERQLGNSPTITTTPTAAPLDDAAAAFSSNMNVKGLTAYFFALYFLMATQDIAVDGWALTMLSKQNREKGPVCNSIGQNIGYFLSFVGFLALNDAESSETIWRPLFGLPSRPGEGLVSLGSFIKVMGVFMLVVTTLVAILKREINPSSRNTNDTNGGGMTEAHIVNKKKDDKDDDAELDASEIGVRETYKRLWAVCQLPAVQWLFIILLTQRFPTALGDQVKFLKAVEYGMSKSTTALLTPTVILPIGILAPVIAARIWRGHPLKQLMTAFQVQISLSPILDILMLMAIQKSSELSPSVMWLAITASTALQAICSSLIFNSKMMFFASRVDPFIGGTYMTLLNTAANMGGVWPSSVVLYLMGLFGSTHECTKNEEGIKTCSGRDAYIPLQVGLSVVGILWVMLLGKRVRRLSELPSEAWRTNLLLSDDTTTSISSAGKGRDEEDGRSNGAAATNRGNNKDSKRE